jgi:hypothetical protein
VGATPTPASTSVLVQVATDVGLFERKATRLLKQAEAEGLVHRWRFGPSKLVQYASVPQLKQTP